MEKYKIGDICEIVSGSTPKTENKDYWDGDLKWITPAEINEDSYIITDTVRKITSLAVKETNLSLFPEGTVILSSRAPIGKVAIAGCEMYCNQGFKNLICKNKINNKYLYWFLNGNTAFLQSLGRGATFKEISKQIVSNIEINVPDYDRQIEVATHLEKINKIIHLRRQELLKFDDLIKSRFIELFGIENELDKWPCCTIGEVADVCVGVVIKPTQYYADKGIDITSEDFNSADNNSGSTDDSSDDGSYDDSYSDDGSYDDGSYDDGSYDDGSYDDGSYDDGSYDDSEE